MTDKIKVRAVFRHIVTVTKEIEMERSEFMQLAEKLDGSGGREYRNTEEDLFARLNVRVDDYDFGANDPELDDFAEVSNS